MFAAFFLITFDEKERRYFENMKIFWLKVQRLITYLSPLRPVYKTSINEIVDEKTAYDVEHYKFSPFNIILTVSIILLAIYAIKQLINKVFE